MASLFEKGESFTEFPFRIIYLPCNPEPYPAVAGILVPKKLIRKAVERNLLKRRIREAYRLSKADFHSRLRTLGTGVNMILLYQHDKVVGFQDIRKGLVRVRKKMLDKMLETQRKGASRPT